MLTLSFIDLVVKNEGRGEGILKEWRALITFFS